MNLALTTKRCVVNNGNAGERGRHMMNDTLAPSPWSCMRACVRAWAVGPSSYDDACVRRRLACFITCVRGRLTCFLACTVGACFVHNVTYMPV